MFHNVLYKIFLYDLVIIKVAKEEICKVRISALLSLLCYYYIKNIEKVNHLLTSPEDLHLANCKRDREGIVSF